MSELYVEDIRQKGLDSFFYFCRAILEMDKLTNRFHREMCEELQGINALRRLWLVPRDHFKSTLVAICFPIWLLVRNPEERILIAADTASNAEKKLKKVKAMITGSKGIRAFYPELIPPNLRKTTWSESEITVPRMEPHQEPSISTIGAGGASAGNHYTRLILDDIIAREASKSPAVMSDAIGWLDGVEDLLVDPYQDTIDVVGTRWTHDDVYDHIEKHWIDGEDQPGRPFYRSFVRSFWESSGKPLFPELYGGLENALDFAQRRKKQNAYLWSCNYENDPTVPEASFDINDLRYYEWDADNEHCLFEKEGRPNVASLSKQSLYMTVDPAYSTKRTASFAAIAVSGVLPTGEVFLIDALRGQWGGQGLLRKIVDLVRKYKMHLKTIGIEATGTQAAFIDDVRKELRNAELFVAVDPLLPGGMASKDDRIRFHLQRYLATKKLYIRSDMQDFERELRHFPLSKMKDLLDATAYAAEHYWRRTVISEHENKEDPDREQERRREATRSRYTGY